MDHRYTDHTVIHMLTFQSLICLSLLIMISCLYGKENTCINYAVCAFILFVHLVLYHGFSYDVCYVTTCPI